MIEALLGAGSSLLGGLLSNNATEKANKQNAAMAEKQYQQQKEFAQSGIQWKVQDAEKAGIHPLYALGANTISYSPQSVGGAASSNFDFLGNAGQNIGRAIDATRSNPGKQQALATTLAGIQIEGAQLDNDLKRAQLASSMALARQGSTPGLPNAGTMPALTGMPGQGDTPQIDGPTLKVQKMASPTDPSNKGVEFGASPEVSLYRTPSGNYSIQIPQTLSEPFEQDWPGFYQWYARNKITPPFTPNEYPGTLKKWHWDPWLGEFSRQPRKPAQWIQDQRFVKGKNRRKF